MAMTRRPNILFLMTDHTNAQALAPGSQCLTPNLDALAAQGVRFGRCTTTNAICSPARATLMTSLYPSAHGMWDCTHTQRAEWVDVPKERFRYFSQNLAEAGYRNAYFGKWHVEQSKKLEDFGWHEYDAACGGAGREVIENTQVVVPREGYTDYRPAGVSTDAAITTHPAFDKGIDFIRRHTVQQPEQPFCCFVSCSEPHDPYNPAKRFFDLYDLDEVQLSPSLHDELDGKPEVIKRMHKTWEALTDAEWRKITACYWAVITFLDAEVGRILDVLRETGQDENTIVVFTSDHGDMLGAHGLCAKGVGTSYEEVYNIPLVLRVPEVERARNRSSAPPSESRDSSNRRLGGGSPYPPPPGSRHPPAREDSCTLTSLVDLAPTLLDFCGAEPLAAAQGRSLRPVLEGSADPDEWRDAYAEFFGQRFVYTQRIVWHGEWKYVFSPGGIDELYNLADDPHEMRNLAEDPVHHETLIEMCKRMWRKMKEIGDLSLFRTHYVTLRTAPVGPLSVGEIE